MKEADEIGSRKKDHVDVVLSGAGQTKAIATGFDHIHFAHIALPEMQLSEVSLQTRFLGKDLRAPFLISSMTGGHAQAHNINLRLAKAAEATGIAFGVGSQRVALEKRGDSAGLDRGLRKAAPNIPIYANFGAAQLALGYGVDEARRAIDMIEADALIIHLNPLQEAVQPGGDHDWRNIYDHIARLAGAIAEPIIVKEVGFGISGEIALRLLSCGVAAVDVAGAGGTNWALVEGARTQGGKIQKIAQGFAGWGIPTAMAVRDIRDQCPDFPMIASGGIRDGVDAAKALRLGADLVGSAAGLLEAATISEDAVVQRIFVMIEQLRIACFCTGSHNLTELRQARLLS